MFYWKPCFESLPRVKVNRCTTSCYWHVLQLLYICTAEHTGSYCMVYIRNTHHPQTNESPISCNYYDTIMQPLYYTCFRHRKKKNIYVILVLRVTIKVRNSGDKTMVNFTLLMQEPVSLIKGSELNISVGGSHTS